MPDIDQLVLSTVKTHKLLSHGQHVVVGVSGGPDSLCLLLLLKQLFPGVSLSAAYIDHQLRPAENQAEKELIEEHCRQLSIHVVIQSVDVPGELTSTGESVEACCRRLRSRALEQIRQHQCADFIAVGHTADDQVEEVLLRLISGSSLKGLSGMSYKNGLVIRPLLDISKTQILTYLDSRDLVYCLDSSNLSDRFLRNRIRHELLPMLESRFNPSIRRTIIQTAERLGIEEDFLRLEAAHLYSEMVSFKDGQEEQAQAPRRVDSAALSVVHPALRRRVIERICWEMGSRPDHQAIVSIDKTLCHGTTGTELHLPNRLRVVKEPESLFFVLLDAQHSKRGRLTLPGTIYFQIPSPGEFQLHDHDMQVSIEVVDRCVDPPSDTSVLDADLISFPLTLRSPQPGDRFTPLGAPGRKTVARFLGERRIAAHRRGRCPVLISGQDIVCVVGVEIDERYRISEQTRRSLLIKIADAQF